VKDHPWGFASNLGHGKGKNGDLFAEDIFTNCGALEGQGIPKQASGEGKTDPVYIMILIGIP